MATLTSQTVTRATYIPVLSADGLTILDMNYKTMIDWTDSQGKVQFTSEKTISIWSTLSALQQASFQAIHSVAVSTAAVQL